ncbi:hypothetical protein TcYC6_0035090 [Trypanosoma cruzi]|nr:hypothetical protein TcYC6_0035090 [Trypanosoma cruzi]
MFCAAEDEAPREKEPNLLDELPPYLFVPDALKHEYSHTDTRTVAAPYFFQQCDAAGYTNLWCCVCSAAGACWRL